ncbi:response regulator [Neoaquamicrobium sediminum]|uniref:response regulator n=1 Tax=Neoaquamicrobium sediminum TaxID=1849104 RepID=UPI003BAA693E
MQDIRLDGMHVLVMEDEFLIAMDVEQLCREHGAAEVTIIRQIEDLREDGLAGEAFHVAVLDLMLGDSPTTEFANSLTERGIPFVFATGYTDVQELFGVVSDIEVVAKPYGGTDLIAALGRAIERGRDRSGGV